VTLGRKEDLPDHRLEVRGKNPGAAAKNVVVHASYITAMPENLAMLDATAQAALVARGDATARELVDAAIERIDRVNPELNAVIHRRDERAHDDASAPQSGPFAGVPFLVKDAVCHTAGDPYHCGMRALKEANWVAPDD